jgi:hypothetical protein
MIVYMTLSEVQSIVTHSCDFGEMSMPEHWQEMMAHKSGHTGFGYLMESMAEHGWSVRHPLPLWAYQPEFSDPRVMINEAHHRLTASILLCMDEIPVWLQTDDDDERHHDRMVMDSFDSVPQIYSHSNNSDPYPIAV